MERIILNKTKRVIAINTLNLIPGANTVLAKDVEKFAKGLAIHEERESIELPQFEVEDDLAEGLISSYSAKDANKIIKETNDLDTLEVYKAEELKGESRKSVLDTLKKQVKKLEAAIKAESEEK